MDELGFNQVITWERRGEKKCVCGEEGLPGSDSNDGL